MDASLLDCDPSKPAPPGKGSGLPPKKKAAGKKAAAGARLKGAFWTKLGDDDLKGTLWADLDEGRGRAGSTVPLPSRDALVAAFGTTKAAKDDKPKEKKPKGPVLTHLVDGKRNQNVLIGLGRVKLSPSFSARGQRASMFVAAADRSTSAGVRAESGKMCETSEA